MKYCCCCCYYCCCCRLCVVVVAVNPRNLPQEFGQIRSVTAEIWLTLILCGWWWWWGFAKTLSCLPQLKLCQGEVELNFGSVRVGAIEDQTMHYIAIGYLLSDTCYKNLRIRISTDRKLSSFFSKFPLNESRKSLFPDKSRELTLTGRTSAKITLIHRLSKT